ncbi:hypothetical protein Goarm_020297 [Gossypium armourianum]|uniref:Uncharacterized protein n=1 Tax=Gossypium armourianum TaxID=34283 RepID=A0A7J9INA7_9ROSI|nr:hypothetical protein [Gossypium armourianum]
MWRLSSSLLQKRSGKPLGTLPKYFLKLCPMITRALKCSRAMARPPDPSASSIMLKDLQSLRFQRRELNQWMKLRRYMFTASLMGIS